MVVIDGSDLVLGRLATAVAKKALLGETIDVVNCEKSIITGNRKTILKKYTKRRQRGIPTKGPFFPRRADMIVRRTIRGMLPYKTTRGREAFKRVRCHIGVPKELENSKAETIGGAHMSKLTSLKHVRVKDLSESLGVKI